MRRRFLYLVASMDCASRKRLACDLAHCPRQGHCRPISAQGSLHIRAVTLAVIEGWHHQCRCRFNDPVLCLSCISSIARVSWCNVERCFIRLLKSAFDRLAQLRQCFSAKPISRPNGNIRSSRLPTFRPPRINQRAVADSTASAAHTRRALRAVDSEAPHSNASLKSC
jgi:hypothetical protein